MTDEELLKVYDETHGNGPSIGAHRVALRAVYERGRLDGARWIPVAERLPTRKQRALWFMPDGAVIVESSEPPILPICTTLAGKATHWMPLPEPPQRAASLATDANSAATDGAIGVSAERKP